MAFDKEEVKQLKGLFGEQEKHFDQKLDGLESRIYKNVDSKIDSKIDNLAIMIRKGFDGCATKQEVAELGNRFDRIELRQDQAAYRFELHALEKRVNVLETEVGVNR